MEDSVRKISSTSSVSPRSFVAMLLWMTEGRAMALTKALIAVLEGSYCVFFAEFKKKMYLACNISDVPAFKDINEC